MPVLLCRSARPPGAGFDRWCAIAGAPEPACLHSAIKMQGLAEKLEAAFDASADEWWNLARALGQEPSSLLAHTPSAAANISDFGLMLAWTRLVDGWAGEHETVLVICDDPWLFRHLARRPGVTRHGSNPPLFFLELRLKLRGLLARFAASRRFAAWARQSEKSSRACPKDRPAILVYAHPASTSTGEDAYFGSLMKEVPDLLRIVHVDASPEMVERFSADKRSFSLHGFGDPAFARRLWKSCWRPVMGSNWLVRRAASREGSTAQGTAIAWQIHCQTAWMEKARPRRILWPWENHAWERALVRSAKAHRIPTIGYQHATVGWREWNYAPHSNPDGLASFPERILTVGAASLARLLHYGCPRHIVSVGGALRFQKPLATRFDPDAPVFVALPFDGVIAGQMIAAIRPLAAKGHRFLIKDHPMTPYALSPEPGIAPAAKPLAELEAVSAVLYCLTSVGLEAVLAGLPTLRFKPEGRVPVDVMPEGFALSATDAPGLEAALAALSKPPSLEASQVFAPADPSFWIETVRA